MEVGSIVEGKVSKITNFGAFVKLDSGEDGLIHISEIADVYVKDIHDYLKEEDIVKVKIVSNDGKKIALSLKQANPKSVAPSPKPFKNRNKEFHKPQKQNSASFEDRLSKFIKESDERLSELRRKTNAKRGGRGSRRSD